MKIKFKEKPSQELIERFCKKVEEFLAPHKLKITVDLWDEALGPLRSYINGSHTEDTYLWVKNVRLLSPETESELDVRLFEQGFPEDMDDDWIWLQAHHVQDLLYSHLKKNPGNPHDGDPYWKLWEVHP